MKNVLTLLQPQQHAWPLDWLAPLTLRLYLAPVFWMAGMSKFNHFADTVEWFGNAEWGLGLPFPLLLAALATAAELGGAVALALGLLVRLAVLPLMVTMAVAMLSVHGANGWLAIAGSGLFANERSTRALERLARAKEILREHGDYEWLTEHGNLVMLNNGIEFAATYFIMLLALLFMGAGRRFSLDAGLARWFLRPTALSG